MSTSKPPPLIRTRQHEPCPVCGEISYSAAGVHPQCSVRQADAKRLAKLKEQQKDQPKAKPVSDVKAWQKRCPKCRSIQHVRKKECDCGHTFGGGTRAATAGDDA